MVPRKNKDRASILLESIIAISIITLLFGSMIFLFIQARNRMALETNEVQQSLSQLNLQLYLDKIGNNIRPPYWLNHDFWSYDSNRQELLIPYYISPLLAEDPEEWKLLKVDVPEVLGENPVLDAFDYLEIKNEEGALSISSASGSTGDKDSEEAILYPGLSLSSVNRIDIQDQGAVGLRLTVMDENEEEYRFILQFGSRTYRDSQEKKTEE